ncbi:TIGR04222 domain-containing membrane protein [Streptomyces sp. TRM68367]|uniref:TIGR04222 domain-containing membrane protein n=1 Tax=Streptomyces sp. TRM68367 TaxID=2758415 RepID=UPI00165AE554|nr:TIGR04222 domain-containing membrane protein [Streptomyces sp. TRM68367]MBC9730415.1 TIGR04222 domain-containing membrane protein [Streptomyces sp. TRM68367]
MRGDTGGTGDTGLCLKPQEIALLHGGPRAAVTVAVVALYLRGAVEAGRPGTVRAAEAASPGPRWEDLETAVLTSLREPAGLRQLAGRRDIRLSVALMRVGLAEAGLLGYPRLRPTRAARRQVRALREQHPLPESRRCLTDHAKLLAVALHDEAALRALVPRFALRAGLTARAPVAGRGLLRHSPHGGDAPFHGRSWYSCGSGGGGTG